MVEDLHWVDPSTLELLGLLIDQVPTTRLYAVFTCRPTFEPPWGFRTHLTRLTLNRLTPPQAEEMMGRMLGGKRLPAEVLQQIVTKTDGIPLFVEEVTKAVVESGLLSAAQDQGTWRGPFPAVAIPTTLHEALMARLDRLGSAKGVAQLGATLGRQFPYVLLRAVSPLEDAPLQRDLATLVAAELLYQRGQPPQAVYMFKHALIQEAAYESVLKSVRRHSHQRIAQILETQFAETAATAPALLAYHALRGELWDKALAYFRQAGEQVVARSAYREAVAAFEQALVALQHLPDSRDTREQAIDLRLALRRRSVRSATRSVFWPTCARPRPSRPPSTTRVGWAGSWSFCQAISSRGARLTRPSQLASAPLRLPQPVERSSSTPGEAVPGQRLRGPGRLSSGDRLPQADRGSPRRGAAGMSASGIIVCPPCSP